MHHTCLKKFIEVVPSCALTDRLAIALDLFSSGKYDRLVVVDEKQYPTGLLRLHHLFPYVLSTSFTSQPRPDPTIDLQTHLSELKPPLLEPLATLPAHLTLEQSWTTLQQMSLPCALVDEAGRFLGLLNPRNLIQFLSEAVGQPSRKATMSAAKIARYALTAQSPQSDSTVLRPLVQLLEQIPLPLMLQTGTGQAIAQNSAWAKQVEEILDPAWVGRDAAAQFARQGRESVAVSGVAAGAEASILPSLCQTGAEPNTCICVCPMKNGQERALQFVKIPLGKTLFGSASVLEWVRSNQYSKQLDAHPLEDTAEYTHFQLAALLNDRDKTRHYGTAASHLSTLTTTAKTGKTQELSPFAQPAGETLWLVMAQDVTEQQQLARELTAKNADLIQLNRLKDEFLACISHELKTPLTAVLGLSTLLKEQAIGELNPRQSRYAQLIYQSGRHLMMVVNDILDLTRMETGQLELVLEPVQISAICARAIEQAQQLKLLEDKTDSQLKATNIAASPFLLEIEPGLDTIVADDLRLRQMLINLLSNALKFTDVAGELGLKVNRWAGWIAFTVWDTGIGIPADKQHLIFQKFQQLENPLTRRFEGTGLGLVLTQRLARLHGGDVTFTSKEGEGSQFTLLLPPSPPRSQSLSNVNVQASTATQRSPASIAPPPTTTANCLIMIVEAVPRYVDELNQLLTELGYLVVIARSGTEALEKARRLQPRVILLNPLLPLLSGWDVLTLIKADAATRHIPTIVTATRAEREQAHRNQADGFLNLPIQATLLQQTLDRLTSDDPTPTTIRKTNPVNLAVLRLRINAEESESRSASHFDLNSLLHAHHYRVLEADDLEQAELLARVWKPRVVLLDGSLPDPVSYLQQLSQLAFLASLPIVTLDQSVTEAANQISGLSVFPCLVELSTTTETNNSQASALLQAIQVATGFTWRPLILTADTLLMPDLMQPSDGELLAEPILQQGEWLQALMQYVQTAGYRSLLGHSWTEVLRRLQHQNADLLLLCWHGDVVSPTMIKAIANLQQLATKPPILVLDYTQQSKYPSIAQSSHLPAAIRELANRVLPASIAITDLLDHIQQVLQ